MSKGSGMSVSRSPGTYVASSKMRSHSSGGRCCLRACIDIVAIEDKMCSGALERIIWNVTHINDGNAICRMKV